MSTITDTTASKVIRRYAIEPQETTINGHRVDVPAPFEVALRYSEADIVTLQRDSQAALGEAIDFARRRGMLPKGVAADVVCVRETLRRA